MFVLVWWEPIVHDDYPRIIPLWVEITGLPLHLWTVKNLKNIGGWLGHIDYGAIRWSFIDRCVDTRKPLVFTKKLQSPSGEEVTIKSHYELLFKHCSCCGLLSHEESYFSKKIEETRAQSAKAGVFARVHYLKLIYLDSLCCRTIMVEVVNLIGMTVRDTMIIPHERIIWMPFHSKRPVLTIGNMVEMTVMIIIPDEQGIGMGISMVRLGHRLQDMDVDILPMSIRNSKNGEINSTKPRILVSSTHKSRKQLQIDHLPMFL